MALRFLGEDRRQFPGRVMKRQPGPILYDQWSTSYLFTLISWGRCAPGIPPSLPTYIGKGELAPPPPLPERFPFPNLYTSRFPFITPVDKLYEVRGPAHSRSPEGVHNFQVLGSVEKRRVPFGAFLGRKSFT